MATIFSSRAGYVSVIREEIRGDGRVYFTDKNGDRGVFDSARIIISGVALQQKVNAQFQESLRNVVYIYSFGDRMGSCVINGLTYVRDCTAKSRAGTGLNDVMAYYSDNRLLAEGTPVFVNIGGESITGFLLGLTTTLASTLYNTNRFELTFAVLPKRKAAI